MSRKRRKKPLPPRRKRMNRQKRLDSARAWIPTYRGGNIVKGYRRWYGVDALCAVKELGMLGVPILKEYRAQLELTEKEKQKAALRRRELREAERQTEHETEDSDPFLGFTGYVLDHLISIGFFEQLDRERETAMAHPVDDEEIPF